MIGCADFSFSLIYRDGDHFSYNLLSTANDSIRHNAIKVKHPYEAASDAVTAVSAPTTTVQETAATSAKKTEAPKTGDHIYWLLLVVPVAAFLVICRKRKSNNV